MKRRWLSLLLALALTIPPAWAAEGAKPIEPTAPEWIRAEDYLAFPGDEVYRPENWARLQTLREDAGAGGSFPQSQRNEPEGSPGTCYELGLIRLRYAANGTSPTNYGYAFRAFRAAREALEEEKGETYYDLYFLELQAYMLSESRGIVMDRVLGDLLQESGRTMEDFWAGPFMDRVTQRRRKALEQEVKDYLERIHLYIDGSALGMDVPPAVRNGRTMVPIRAVAEALGADVNWDQETKQITLIRAGSIVTMTLDSTAATVDGVAMEMDVAPYAVDGRTLIPARYAAEFFGQKVSWNGEERRVDITEDKSVMGRSNLEAWALPMGAMLALVYRGAPSLYGNYSRTSRTVTGLQELKSLGLEAPVRQQVAQGARQVLEMNWGVTNREELMATVGVMTLDGNDSGFRWEAILALSIKDEDFDAYVASLGDEGWRVAYTEELARKWGDKGIWAWDLFRMSNLVQWGYAAGYLTYRESLALLEPAATILSQVFTSWDEAYENFLDGYHWQSWTDPEGKDTWETPLGKFYQEEMKGHSTIGPLFDDTLFKVGVIGVLDQTPSGVIA